MLLKGDSGGPLICLRGTQWYQFGVVSFGSGCGEANAAGFYASVTDYADWIITNTNGNIIFAPP